MSRVLIVEDEVTLRASMARALLKVPTEVAEAGTVAEAIAELERALPDLIICDLDLPDGLGLELIGAMDRLGARVPLVFVSAYVRAYRAQLPHDALVEVREKPLPLADLRALVHERLQASPRRAPTIPPPVDRPPPAAETALAPFTVADYIQVACLSQRSVVIDVAQRGQIAVVRGELWHAADLLGTGRAAFRRLAYGSVGAVACRPLSAMPRRRTLEGAWESLLLDAAREFDEAAHDLGDDGPEVVMVVDDPAQPAATPAPVASGPADAPGGPDDDEAFADARDRAVEALLVRDYATATHLFAIAQALRPDDRTVAANVARLAKLGATTP